MARPYWSGQIQISLVSFGVKLFVATEARSQINFHQIDRNSGERVKHQKVLASAVESDPEDAAAPVEHSQILKGYEYSKGQYVTFEAEEIAGLRVPSKHTMEVTQFVSASEIDPEYFEKPYFVVPENAAQSEAFATVRKALIETKKLALSKVAFGGREHIVAIAPAGSDAHGGMMAYTLRYAAELRDSTQYFRDIRQHKVEADSLALAKELISRKSGHFQPDSFEDGYEIALKEMVDAKLAHLPLPKEDAPAPQRGKVINLMDALKRSVARRSTEEDEQPIPAKTKKPALKLVKNGSAKKPTTKHAASKPTRRKSA
ncbi:MAG: Ku protein [Acidobacteriaceae bacterium]|nr:Ku protein [Acidobacteriaceae bacterium]